MTTNDYGIDAYKFVALSLKEDKEFAGRYNFDFPSPINSSTIGRLNMNKESGSFAFPAINEGDYLTLLTFQEHKISNYVCEYVTHKVKMSIEELIDKIEEGMGVELIDAKMMNNHVVLVFKDFLIKIVISNISNLSKHCVVGEKQVYSYFYANRKDITRLAMKYRDLPLEIEDTTPYVNWVFLSDKGVQTKRFKASKKINAKDIFYPNIAGGVEDYYEKYEASTSPLLIILGPPGMGKTSFIKNYIYKYNKKPMISYDEALMESDQFFLMFLESENDVLVGEDFDVFLRSREESNNIIMNKFLNLSEGIVDISQKKIIFTANLDRNSIDPALMRPGRCYDVLEFDAYSAGEAEQIIESEGLTYDGSYDNVTLAELFNNKPLKAKRRVGF